MTSRDRSSRAVRPKIFANITHVFPKKATQHWRPNRSSPAKLYAVAPPVQPPPSSRREVVRVPRLTLFPRRESDEPIRTFRLAVE